MTAGPGPGAAAGGRRPLGLQPVGLQQVGALQVRWRTVPVSGGDLAVATWGDDDGAGEVVVGVHGLTGNALVWAGVAGLLDGDPPVLAPDLRGRGGSRALPGPYGLRAHVDDLVALLDALGRERAAFAGHGTGAGVVALLAERHPERVAGLVLVDPAAPPPREVESRVLRRFPGRQEHRESWREEPGLGGPWNGLVEEVVARDAAEDGQAVSRALAPEAVRADLAELATVPPPQAPAGTAVVLPEGDAAAPVPSGVSVSGTSHWTLLLGLRGADAVSRALLAVL